MSKATPENTAPVQEPQVPTTLADIKSHMKKKALGEPITLPVSGLTFMLGKPSISHLLKEDAIPAELVIAAINLDSQENKLPENREDYLKTLAVMDKVICAAGIMPKIVMTEAEVTDDSIWIEQLDDNDRISIYLYAQMGVKPELKSFREGEQDGDGGSTVSKVSRKKTK